MADTIAYILVTTDLGRAKTVAEGAVALDGVQWAAVVSGPCNVIVGAKVSGSAEMGGLVAQIDGLRGVRGTEMALMSSFHAHRSVQGVIHPP